MPRNPRGASSVSHQPLGSNSPVPLYHRLYLILKERIINGVYRPGALLPTENELISAYGVARNTVKRALNDLADDGLVSRSRGRGTLVMPNSAMARMQAPISANIDNLWPILSTIGQVTTIDLKTFEFVPVNEHVAEQLGIPAGTTILHSARVRSSNGAPFSYSQSFMPEDVGRTFTKADLRKHPLIDLIKRAKIRVVRVQQAITCRLADEVASAYLKVEAGSPLLKLRRVYFNESERAINYAEILYNPRLFEYRMSWTQGGGNRLRLDSSTHLP